MLSPKQTFIKPLGLTLLALAATLAFSAPASAIGHVEPNGADPGGGSIVCVDEATGEHQSTVDDPNECPAGTMPHYSYQATGDPTKSDSAGNCPAGYIKLSVPVDEEGNDCLPRGEGVDDNPIFHYLRAFVRFMAAGAAVLTLLLITIGGVMYITSSGNPDGVKKAKRLLGIAVSILVMFILMGAILNFLIPGGILR